MTLLAFTHRMMAEAVVFKDPWTYKSTNGGGTILQRFGTPKKWDSGITTMQCFDILVSKHPRVRSRRVYTTSSTQHPQNERNAR